MMLRTTYAKRPQGDYCDHHRGKPSPIRWAGLAGLVLVLAALKAPSAAGGAEAFVRARADRSL
jgi:hypothetical protein